MTINNDAIEFVTKTIPTNDNKAFNIITGASFGPGVFDYEKVLSLYTLIDGSVEKVNFYKVDNGKNKLIAISNAVESVTINHPATGVEGNFLKVSFDKLIVSSGSEYYMEVILSPDSNGAFVYLVGTTLDITTHGTTGDNVGFTPILCYDSADPGSELPDVEISDTGDPVEPETPEVPEVPEVPEEPAKTIFDNSIWPNGLKADTENYAIFYQLGTNKVPVPSDISEWPAGNKLISPFVYQDDMLVGLCDTKAMVLNESCSTTIPYEEIIADFPSIKNGKLYIEMPNAITTNITWALPKYKNCYTLDNIISIEPNYQTVDIIDGKWDEDMDHLKSSLKMFDGNTNLKSFESAMTHLTDGRAMFRNCTELETCYISSPSLTSGSSMFSGCVSLIDFNCDTSKLKYGNHMFENCSNLESFTLYLPQLEEGMSMFEGCTKLSTFNAELEKLIMGYNMFSGCKLTPQSVAKIINDINTVGDLYTQWGSYILTLGIDCAPDGTELPYNYGINFIRFAQEAGYNDEGDLMYALSSKGWSLYVQLNGQEETSTYSLRNRQSLPIFVKLIETDEHPNYISADGTKKYRFMWFHISSGTTDDCIQFNSLDEAIETLNIKPIERN